jgi:hypothetical protein
MTAKFQSMQDVAREVYEELFGRPARKALQPNYTPHPDFADDGMAAGVLEFAGAGGVSADGRTFRALAMFADALTKYGAIYEETNDPAAHRMVTLCVLAEKAILARSGIVRAITEAEHQTEIDTCQERWEYVERAPRT